MNVTEHIIANLILQNLEITYFKVIKPGFVMFK